MGILGNLGEDIGGIVVLRERRRYLESPNDRHIVILAGVNFSGGNREE